MTREEDLAEVVETTKNQLCSLESSLKRMASEAKKLKDPSLIHVKTTISLLDSVYEQASNVLLKLEGFEGPQQQQRREPLMAIYLNAKVTLEELAQALRPAPTAGSPNGLLDQTIQQSASRADHLPRIDLPRFNGSPTEWLAFKSRFEKRIATIGEDADKFAFLTKCLEHFEPAKNSIEALENSGATFVEAWAKLETRFYKKRIAYEGYFSKLLKLKKSTTPNAKAIMALIDAVDTTVHAAKQIQNDRNPNLDCVANGLLVSLVKARLDEGTLSRMEDKMDLQTVYTWTEFKGELEKHANQLACLNMSEVKSASTKVMGALTQTKNYPENKKSHPCDICAKDGHKIWSCPEFATIKPRKRQEVAKQKRLCFNCLQKGHGVSNCRSTYTCRTCQGKHHSMLHEEKDSTATPPLQQVNAVSNSAPSSSNSQN